MLCAARLTPEGAALCRYQGGTSYAQASNSSRYVVGSSPTYGYDAKLCGSSLKYICEVGGGPGGLQCSRARR